MTEQEAFEQYWGRKESETQEFQHPDFKKCKVTWKIACEWQRSECNEELVMLRQRVKELEVDNGLTIAYMSGFRDGKKDAQKHGEPVLYQCTKCGGANYACDCDSFRYCTKPLYEGRGDA